MTFESIFIAGVWSNPDAKRLYEELLLKNGYNKLIRPVGNNNDQLTVKLGLRLSQLIDVVCIFLLLCLNSMKWLHKNKIT